MENNHCAGVCEAGCDECFRPLEYQVDLITAALGRQDGAEMKAAIRAMPYAERVKAAKELPGLALNAMAEASGFRWVTTPDGKLDTEKVTPRPRQTPEKGRSE